MELQDSLFNKILKENSLYSEVKKEFAEIMNLKNKLDAQNKYLDVIHYLENLIKKGDLFSLQSAQKLLEPKEYIFDNFFQKSDFYKLEPSQTNNKQTLTLKNYIIKQIFFNNNFKLVNENFQLRNEIQTLKLNIENFNRYENEDSTPSFKSLGVYALWAGISFILFFISVVLSDESGGIGFKLLNSVFVMSMLGGIGFVIYEVFRLFLTKSGLNYISKFRQNKLNKQKLKFKQNRLNKISPEIDRVLTTYKKTMQ